MNKKLVMPILIGFGIIVLIAIGWVILTQEQAVEPVSGTNTAASLEPKTENDEVKLTQEQYKAILNAIFAADKDGKVMVKTDVIMQAVMDLKQRVDKLEGTEPIVEQPVEQPLEVKE